MAQSCLESLPHSPLPTPKKQQSSSTQTSYCSTSSSHCVYSFEPSGGNTLADEYRTLSMLTDKPMSFGERVLAYPSATTFWTSPKNRYPDVLPKEDTRVRLKCTGTDGSDYINANHVFEKQYIATQAPLCSTAGDFWRMIWEQGVCVIVMLTKLVERQTTKAHIYWPQVLGERIPFEHLTVELLHETSFDNIECRLLRLSDGPEHRDVYHLYYTGWPDFGVPQSTKEIIDLVKVTNYLRARAGWEKPIVTHCSAGIGRAGTFIAIHQAVRLLNVGKRPKVLDLVFAMRQCRHNMVQTEEQYLFIHQAIHDYEKQMEEEAATSTSETAARRQRKANSKRCSMDEQASAGVQSPKESHRGLEGADRTYIEI